LQTNTSFLPLCLANGTPKSKSPNLLKNPNIILSHPPQSSLSPQMKEMPTTEMN